MADVNYGKRLNDRREGRVLRSLPPFSRLIPYIMRQRSDACDTFSDALEVSGIEQWLRDKRGEGWTGLGFLHLIVAAYVRTVSMRPGINRFVAGRRIHARNDIQVVLTVKRAQSADASRTTIKVSFSPTDTVFDVYRRLSDAVDEVKADVTISEPERIAGDALPHPPGVFAPCDVLFAHAGLLRLAAPVHAGRQPFPRLSGRDGSWVHGHSPCLPPHL